MNMEAISFQYDASDVRVLVKDDGNPWFCVKDICEVLQIRNARKVLDHIDSSERDGVYLSDVTGRHQKMNVISESGLYKLIMRSDKPEARKFQDWVTREVLPSIRKTGFYSVNGANVLPPMSGEDAAATQAAVQLLVLRARQMNASRRWQLRVLMVKWGLTADEFKALANQAADVPGTIAGYDFPRWDVAAPTAADIRRVADRDYLDRHCLPEEVAAIKPLPS